MHILLLLLLTLDVIGVITSKEEPIPYKEQLIRTDELCPDVQESLKGKDLDTANFPYKSIFRLAEPRTSDPCIFESKAPGRRNVNLLIIKAINTDDVEWDYSQAQQPCYDVVKLRLPHFRTFGDRHRSLCTVIRPGNPTKASFKRLSINPKFWELPRGRMGISFPIGSSRFPSRNNETAGVVVDEAFANRSTNVSQGPKFLQIIYNTLVGDSCSLRVQQYRIDPKREVCKTGGNGHQMATCGMYDCSQERAVLAPIGFWGSDQFRYQQTQKIVEFVHMRQFHPYQPSFIDFFLGFCRLLILPTLFLGFFYTTRQLRMKLASRQLLRDLRNVSRANGLRMGGSRVSADIGNDIGTVGKTEDLPPSYESVMAIPTYAEASRNVKSFFPLQTAQTASTTPPIQSVHNNSNAATSLNSSNTNRTTNFYASSTSADLV